MSHITPLSPLTGPLVGTLASPSFSADAHIRADVFGTKTAAQMGRFINASGDTGLGSHFTFAPGFAVIDMADDSGSITLYGGPTGATLALFGGSTGDFFLTTFNGANSAQLHGTPAAGVTSPLTWGGKFTPAGLLDLSTSTAGQIQFPASKNASANVNTLDDYVEGTWVPTVTATAGTFTTTSATGEYTKIGNRVWWKAAVVITTVGTASGNIIFTLPFTSSGDACGWGREVALNNKVVSSQNASGTNTSDIILYDGTSAITAATQYRLSGHFRV